MNLRITLVVSLAISVLAIHRNAKVGPGAFFPEEARRFAEGARDKVGEFVQNAEKAGPGALKKAVTDGAQSVMDNVQKLSKYTFSDYVREYSRPYQQGTQEWKEREQHFQKNLNMILQQNSGDSKHMWKASVNKFMDASPDENKMLLGHKGRRSRGASSLLQADDVWDESLVMPEEHTWTAHLAKSRSHKFDRDQGSCGSCWATAAIQVLEDHLTIHSNHSVQLSAQHLVSCTPNPEECGGTGGCQGATAELAYKYLVENGGVAAERTWSYHSGHGGNGACDRAANKHVAISGFNSLPVNKYWPLMRALYESGPVVISVAAGSWFMYGGGIFSGCDKNAIINHAVVCEGFGESKSHKFFKVKNSWGPDWGEQGYIRLLREDGNAKPGVEPSGKYMRFGIDNKPEDGNGCKGGAAEMVVAGMCGMLSDSVYPTGARYISVAEGGTFVAGQEDPSVFEGFSKRPKKKKAHEDAILKEKGWPFIR